jgi:ABC-2 type transport system permease protein
LHKILIVAKRDYVASVRTKAFLFGLVIAPLLFGGSILGVAIVNKRPDVRERRVAIIDHTGLAAGPVTEAIQRLNRIQLFDRKTGRRAMPKYQLETVVPDAAASDEQRLELSDRIRHGDLFGFLDIGASAMRPGTTADAGRANAVTWYSNEDGLGQARQWLMGPMNDGLRRARLAQLGVDKSRFDEVLGALAIQGGALVTRDAKTGQIRVDGGKNGIANAAIPVALGVLLAMIVMMTSAPMLPAIAEDKMQRIFEMLLASATPFELIAGKVVAAIGRSLTTAAVYIAGAPMALHALGISDLAPLRFLPWFLVYLLAEVIILSAFASVLGAACGSPQDAQNLNVLLIAPMIIPLFMITPLMQQPNGSFATAMSLIPLFTPVMMLMRQSMPAGVPAWQPWAGLAGIAVTTVLISWLAARLFRLVILLQGKSPKPAELVRWAIRG